LFGELAYNQKAVYIVEIEQDESWGPSTWIFSTSEDTRQYTEDDMKDIINHYSNQKEHKKSDVYDDSIERWCESVLKKLVK